MLKQKKILILTSKTGGGHMSLAEALRDLIELDFQTAFEERKGAAEDTHAPAITITDPQPGFLHLYYRLVSRHALRLWAAGFAFSNTPQRALLAHRIFTRLVGHRLHALLDAIQPDLILTTHPFLSYEVWHILKCRSAHIPLILLLSDPNIVHALWLSECRATAILAPTQETYKQALEAGLAPGRLHLVGWPVRAQFLQAPGERPETHMELLDRLHLAPDRFTVFLQGGGEGAAHVERTIENLAADSALANRVQVILAAGANTALQKRYKHARNLAVLPYTKEIAPFMAAADIIIGKAGPNVLFESVMLGKPFVATTFMPGQEQANLAVIQRYGLGWVAIQPEEQRSLLAALAENADYAREMSASIKAYRQWNREKTKGIAPLMRSFLLQAR